jgi:hypothetical protein
MITWIIMYMEICRKSTKQPIPKLSQASTCEGYHKNLRFQDIPNIFSGHIALNLQMRLIG